MPRQPVARSLTRSSRSGSSETDPVCSTSDLRRRGARHDPWILRRSAPAPASGRRADVAGPDRSDDAARFDRGHMARRAYSLSALERYQDCPFKFFAAGRAAPRGSRPRTSRTLSPRARGRFIHEVFSAIFRSVGCVAARERSLLTPRRGPRGHGGSRRAAAVAGCPEPMPRSSARGCSGRRSRSGSSTSSWPGGVAAGRRSGSAGSSTGSKGSSRSARLTARRVPLRGVADRIDLLDGRPSARHRLQVGLSAERAAARCRCRSTRCALRSDSRERDGAAPGRVDEAAYICVQPASALWCRWSTPVIRTVTGRCAAARARLSTSSIGIDAGEFPPRPHDPMICTVLRVCIGLPEGLRRVAIRCRSTRTRHRTSRGSTRAIGTGAGRRSTIQRGARGVGRNRQDARARRSLRQPAARRRRSLRTSSRSRSRGRRRRRCASASSRRCARRWHAGEFPPSRWRELRDRTADIDDQHDRRVLSLTAAGISARGRSRSRVLDGRRHRSAAARRRIARSHAARTCRSRRARGRARRARVRAARRSSRARRARRAARSPHRGTTALSRFLAAGPRVSRCGRRRGTVPPRCSRFSRRCGAASTGFWRQDRSSLRSPDPAPAARRAGAACECRGRLQAARGGRRGGTRPGPRARRVQPRPRALPHPGRSAAHEDAALQEGGFRVGHRLAGAPRSRLHARARDGGASRRIAAT